MKYRLLFIIIVLNLILMDLNGAIIKKEQAFLTESAFYEDDYLFFGNELIFRGMADDLYFFGEKLNFNGETKSSLNALGNFISIAGKVNNNLTLGARNAEIVGEINGTTFLLGENISIEKDAVINGTVFCLSRELKIRGIINGDVYTASGILIIAGQINGNIKASTGNLYIQDDGKINGNLSYESEREISNSDKSKITGTVNFKELQKGKGLNYFHKKEGFFKKSMAKIVFISIILISFLVGGLLLLLFPVLKKVEEERTGKNFWFDFLWGLIPFLIYPVVIGILILLVITIPISVILFMFGLPMMFMTIILGITLFGQYLMNLFKWNINNRFLFFLFGILFFVIIMFLPVLKILGIIFFSSLGWGLILEGLFKRKLS